MYQVLASDGNGNVARVRLTKDEIKKIIGDSILHGVIASSEIEGEGGVEVKLEEVAPIPEQLLRIP